MTSPLTLVGVLGLTAALLSAPSAAQAAPDPLDAPGQIQPADSQMYAPPAPPRPNPGVNVPSRVQPDHAYSANGARVEIYSSVGDNDGGEDWRPISAYSHLVASVPKDRHLYSTVYNSLHDHKRTVFDTATKKWKISSLAGGTYTPTQAFLDVINQYDNTDVKTAAAKKYIHTLGNKTSINDAAKIPSSLAVLIKAATDYKDCPAGQGACLTTRSGENFMHAKYAAFQETRDSTGTLRPNVVWITSSNLNGASGGKKSNVSIAIYNDKKAYDGLVKLFELQRTRNKTKYFADKVNQGIETTSGITLFASPRAPGPDMSKVDFEAQLLQQSKRARLSGTRTDCQVHAVHSLFSRVEVRDGLGELQADGCDVKLVLGNNAISDVASYYFKTSTQLRELVNNVQFANVHDKTLSVSYKLPGRSVGTTFGGSANFNGTSLQYDELAFRADDVDFTKVAQRHAERLYLLAKGADSATPVSSVKVTPSAPTVVVGQSLQLKTTVLPTDASVKTVTWSSDNPDVASVDAQGKVAAGLLPSLQPVRIKALSVSGAKVGEALVTVAAAGTTTPADGSPEPTLKVTTPPELSMSPTQGPMSSDNTPVVVSWSQGEVDLNGTVMLQYHTGTSSWKNYKAITVRNGRGTAKFAFKASHTWRAVGTKVTTPKTSMASQRVSRDFVPNVVRSSGSSATPRVYAPTLVKKGTKVLYTFSWNNPYRSRKGINNNIRLQYYTGKKWVTATTIAIPKGVFNFDGSHPAVKSRKWRIASGLTSQPKGVKAKVSPAVMIRTQ